MKRREKNPDEIVDTHLGAFSLPPLQEIADARERTLQRLRLEPVGVDLLAQKVDAGRFGWRWRVAIVGAAAAVLVVVFMQAPALRNFNREIDAHAVAESADGTLSRVVGEKTEIVRLRERIESGEILSTNEASATIALADGSRVELRSRSKLSVERAVDGVRIHLFSGGLIINAAKQVAGHLYVQTKDVTVSVVGTVFVVNAEEEGSRVAVIEGEVRVQQGTTTKNLLPGEQLTTNPKMRSLPVNEEVAWSHHAEEHVALLQQAPAFKEERVAFEVASIKPGRTAASAAPGARGGGGNSGPTADGCVPDSSGYSQQLDPRRLAINRATLLMLVGYAYPDQILRAATANEVCPERVSLGLLSGGPEWVKTDVWALEAVIPEGSFSLPPTLADPKLQRMLQTLLAERFKVVVRRETREMPVYLLKVGKNGPKFNGPNKNINWFFNGPDGKPKHVSELTPSDEGGSFGTPRWMAAYNVTMEEWAKGLFNAAGRPVFDRTGLTGKYSFYFQYPESVVGYDHPIQLDTTKEIGLDLEESKAPVEVWVIDRAEKPSEN